MTTYIRDFKKTTTATVTRIRTKKKLMIKTAVKHERFKTQHFLGIPYRLKHEIANFYVLLARKPLL